LEALEDRFVPAVYAVTTTTDVVDPNDGRLSRREAVLADNTTVGVEDTITLPVGTYVLTQIGANEDAAATGDLDVTDRLTILGAGRGATVIDGSQTDRVFDLRTGFVTFNGLTVQNGRVLNDVGGGVQTIQCHLVITDCAVTGNQAVGADTTMPGAGTPFGQGGGIFQCGSLVTLTGCVVSNNRAVGGTVMVVGSPTADGLGDTAEGGGIYSTNSGGLQLTDSTVAGNQANGGAASNSAGGARGGRANGGRVFGVFVTLTGCTISDNIAIGGTGSASSTSLIGVGGAGQDGGVYATDGLLSGNLIVIHSTITGNRAVGGDGTNPAGMAVGGNVIGGGLYHQVSLFQMSSSLVGGNRAEAGGASAQRATGGRADGGGLALMSGNYEVTNSTFAGNRVVGVSGTGVTQVFVVDAAGGGISCTIVPGTVDNSIVSGNVVVGGAATMTGPSIDGISGDARGGGISADAVLLTNGTVTLNSAAAGAGNRAIGVGLGGGYGAPLLNNGAGLTVRSTIIANNSASAAAPDVGTTLAQPGTSLGHNLIGDGSGSVGLTNGVGDQIGGGANPALDARLGPLKDNGGPTPTHALLTGSPAIDRGSNAAGLANDPRGDGFARTVGLGTDVGALESPITVPAAVIEPLGDVTASNGTAYTITVTYSDDVAIDASTLNTGDVRVTGRNGFNALATFVGVDAATNGSPRTATYRITPPGGSWDVADVDAYTVSLEPNQVADIVGDFAAATSLGTFRFILPTTFVVTTTADSGPGSLRDAIAETNANAGAADAIAFDPTVFSVPRTIGLSSGQLTFTDTVTIQGPGATLLMVSVNSANRIFLIDGTDEIDVTLAGMTLSAGRRTGSGTGNSGGAVLNQGDDLTIRDSVITDSRADAGGGAISVQGASGSLAILNTDLRRNTTSGTGGAI
jgi:hypothetical protein